MFKQTELIELLKKAEAEYHQAKEDMEANGINKDFLKKVINANLTRLALQKKLFSDEDTPTS